MKNKLEKIKLGLNVRVEKTNPRAWTFSISAIDKPTKDFIVSFVKEENTDEVRKREKMQPHRELFDENTLVVFERYETFGINVPDAIQEFENNFKFPIDKRERFFEWVGAQLYKFLILLTDDSNLSLKGKTVVFYLDQKEETEDAYYFNKFNFFEVCNGMREVLLNMIGFIKNQDWLKPDEDDFDGMPYSTYEYKHISRSRFDFNFDKREFRSDKDFLTIKDQEDRG